MKKGLKLLGCILCTALFFSCADPSNDNGGSKPGPSTEKKTLTEQIEAANGTIDFKGAKISEDALVDDTVTIKNLDMDEKTLTVSASGVVLENVNNAVVIVAGGDVILKNCTNIIKLEVNEATLDSDTSDEIIIDASQIETIEINKDGIRIVLKDKDTKVAEIIVSAEDTTLEAEKKENEDAPVVETLTVTEDADNVSISGGKIENLVIEIPDSATEEDQPTVILSDDTQIENETVQKVPFKGGDAQQYIEAAIKTLTASNKVFDIDIDLAISYFKKAYETEQTDETKLYYALAELASISTDESVAKLLKENFGIINYPASPNALLSGDWLKEYEEMGTYYAIEFEKDPDGDFVRGKMPKNPNDITALRFNSKYLLHDEYWIYTDEWNASILNIEPSTDGEIMFSLDYDKDLYNSEVSPKVMAAFRETYKDCFYSITGYKFVKMPSSVMGDDIKAVAPEFTVIDKNDPNYQATLFNSVQTSETAAYLLLSNFFTCNAEGFNKLIDNILNVYNNRFENAKALVADLNQESIPVPADIIKALELNEFFGENTVKIGKAEVDVLFSAMDIYKGLFQWFSSYDLSLDLDVIKNRMFQLYNPNDPYASWGGLPVKYTQLFRNGPELLLAELYNLTNEKTFTVRSESAMAASKNTILNAANKILASYEYITGDSKIYPSEVKAQIEKNAGPVYAYVKEFAKTLKNGTIFEVKDEDAKTVFAIDLGKFFTAGYFTNLVEKNSNGDIKFTAMAYMTDVSKEPIPFKDNEEYEFDLSKTYSEVNRILKPEADALDWDEMINVRYILGYVSIKLSKILDLMPGMIPLTDVITQFYDETSGTLKMPFTINAWQNIFKPLADMECSWFATELDLVSYFEAIGAKDDDFINIEIRNPKSFNSTSVFLGDVKTIKESGFVMYGAMNQYLPSSLMQYPTRESILQFYSGAPENITTPGVAILYVYSNMDEENPGTDLSISIGLYKQPIVSAYSYPEYTSYVSRYNIDNPKWEFGYAKELYNRAIPSTFKKVE